MLEGRKEGRNEERERERERERNGAAHGVACQLAMQAGQAMQAAANETREAGGEQQAGAMAPQEAGPAGEAHPADVIALAAGAAESQKRNDGKPLHQPLREARSRLVEVLPYLETEVAAIVRGAIRSIDEWTHLQLGESVILVEESQQEEA